MKRLFTLLLPMVMFTLSSMAQDPMVLVFNTTPSKKTIILPLQGSVNVTVNWGDGETDTYTTAGLHSHTYTTAGEYSVSIQGSLQQFGDGSNPVSYADNLTKVLSFGDLGIQSLYGAFAQATNLVEAPSVLPSSVTNLSHCFYEATNFNFPIGTWDVSNVTDMTAMFQNATKFNQDISDWDVLNVTNMMFMFSQATSFDQDISKWDVSNVTTLAAFLDGGKLSTYHYNRVLEAWRLLNLRSSVPANFGTSKYSSGNHATYKYEISSNYNWSFTDAGETQLPVVNTVKPYSISESRFTSGGEVVHEGSSYVTERGIVVGSTPNPLVTYNVIKTNNGSGLGSFPAVPDGSSSKNYVF